MEVEVLVYKWCLMSSGKYAYWDEIMLNVNEYEPCFVLDRHTETNCLLSS